MYKTRRTIVGIIVIKPGLADPYSLTWPHKGGAKEAVYPRFMGPAGARKDSWQFYLVLVTTVGISAAKQVRTKERSTCLNRVREGGKIYLGHGDKPFFLPNALEDWM